MLYLKIFILMFWGCHVNAVSLHFEDEVTSRHGLGWPPTLQAAVGTEALMKLSIDLENQQSCIVSTPFGVIFEASSTPGNEYQSWSDGCGIRVRHVRPEDEGRWRLTASRGNNSITGWIELTVLSGVQRYEPPPISLRDGDVSTFVNLTSLNNAYCVVAKPFTDSSLLPGHCNLTVERTTRSIQGNWNIFLGVPGHVTEIRASQPVRVEAERLDVGFINDVNARKIHLYCNILHTTRNISFCRFQKTSSTYGFNVIDGLSDGSHSYYGEGFALKQCGMTIEHSTSEDYGTWRCSVGVSELINRITIQRQPMQALINVQASPRTRIRKQATFTEVTDIRTVFVQEDMQFTISCQAESSLTYCWFQHPNGSQFTPVERSDENQLFWYAGESLDTGDCGITFTHANISDAGQWICHMGPRNGVGLEITDQVNLRVTGSLAANQQQIGVTVGQNATLFCHSSNGNRPLRYCRFLSPRFVGINIDSSITAQNTIMGRFYFTPGRDINYGHCSLSIMSVQYEDIGIWSCAAIVDDEIMESRDTILLFVSRNSAPRFRAGFIGISVGLAFLVSVLVGYLLFKKGWVSFRRKKARSESRVDEFSLQTRPSVAASTSSEESNNRF